MYLFILLYPNKAFNKPCTENFLFLLKWLPIMWAVITKVMAEINIFSNIIIFIQILTYWYIGIWFCWIFDKWGRDLNKMRIGARKYWINKWEGCKNIEYFQAVMGRINRRQWSWRVMSSYRKGEARTCGFSKFFTVDWLKQS